MHIAIRGTYTSKREELEMDFSLHLHGLPGVRINNPGSELREWCDELKVDIHMSSSSDRSGSFSLSPPKPTLSFFFQHEDLEKSVEIVDFLKAKVVEQNQQISLTTSASINGIPLEMCIRRIAFTSRHKLAEIRQLVLTERRSVARLSERYRRILELTDEGLSFLRN